MKFEETKIPQTDKNRKAYDLFLNKLPAREAYYKKVVIQDIQMQIDDQIMMLTMGSRLEEVKRIEEQRANHLVKLMPQVEVAVKKWRKRYVESALKSVEELKVVSDVDVRDTLISAALASYVVSSMMDVKDVANKLDEEVLDVLALYNENLRRPLDFATKMRQASSSQKIYALLDIAVQFKNKQNTIEKTPLPMGHPVLMLNVREVKETVQNAKICYGLDKAVDAVFVKSFNKLNETFKTGVSVEDENGLLKMKVVGNQVGPIMIKSPVAAANSNKPGAKGPIRKGPGADIDETGKIKGPKPKW